MFLQLSWLIVQGKKETVDLSFTEARANCNKDWGFRSWAALHGGVYVPITKKTQPNPYLSYMPERDIETPSGIKLTLMNPAYILRQLQEHFSELYGIKGRMVSLKPINPSNKPDPWERNVLLAFEGGKEEASEFTKINNKPYLRFMRPVFVKKHCLKCHEHQGYKVGEVSGGVNVSLPIAKYLEREHKNMFIHIASYCFIWILGLLGIYMSGREILMEIKKRICLEKEIKYMAYHDSVTSLPNRRMFEEHLTRELIWAERKCEKFSLLFIDLDNFKVVNDTFGHNVGDLLLKIVAKKLKACLRKYDIVSRVGGDEFAIILSQISHLKDVDIVTKKIIDSFKLPFEIDNNELSITVSIGGVVYPEHGNDREKLLKNADCAMYHVKKIGRNGYKLYDESMLNGE